mgnify:CR=1 FL=1
MKVKVNSVKAEELPELNDEFASEASEFDTLDELKADIRKAAAQDAEGRQATEARDAFIAKLQEGLEIPVPKGVKAEMVEQQLKNVTADPSKATKEQKAEAEETVEKELRDQMVLDVLAQDGIETEMVHVGNKAIRGCLACGQCIKHRNERCIQDDEVNEWIQKMKTADGILIGSPVHFSAIGGTMKSFLDRAFYVTGVNGGMLRHKVGAAVVAVRLAT